MNKFIKLSLIMAVAVAAVSCNCFKKMAKNPEAVKVTTNPEILTLNNDKVPFEISMEFPPKYFNKKAVVKVTPVLTYEGGEIAAPDIMLQGSAVKSNYKVVDYTFGETVVEKSAFPYTDKMRRGVMQVRLSVACNCSDCDSFVLINPATGAIITEAQQEVLASNPRSAEAKAILDACSIPVSQGVNTLQQDFSMVALMANMKDDFKRVTTTVEKADLKYSISSSTVSSSSLKSADIKAFAASVGEYKGNDRATQTLYANGYASPDGPEKFNDKLSKARATSGQKAAQKLLKEYGLDIDAASYGEDWDGFKALVKASNIEDKALILKVLNMYDSSTERETQIKNLAEVFAELKSDVLPELRRAQLMNSIKLQGKSDEEMIELVKRKRYMELNTEEILYICAKLKVDPKTKVILLDFAAKKFGDPRAWNNLGVAQAAVGKYELAEQAFKSAIKAGAKGSEISRNMTIIALEKGNIEEAAKYAKGSDAVAKSAVAAFEGNYAPAAKAMKGYNAAIANVQLGNYAAAKSALGKDKSANAEYLRAVIACREGDVKSAETALKAAIKKDKKLSAKAKSDVNLMELTEAGFAL